MSGRPEGRRIAFLVAREGVEQVELTAPWKAVEQAGRAPEPVSTEDGEIQACDHGTRVDEGPVVDEGLAPSRNADGLPAFGGGIVEEFCEGVHEGRRQSASRA